MLKNNHTNFKSIYHLFLATAIATLNVRDSFKDDVTVDRLYCYLGLDYVDKGTVKSSL